MPGRGPHTRALSRSLSGGSAREAMPQLRSTWASRGQAGAGGTQARAHGYLPPPPRQLPNENVMASPASRVVRQEHRPSESIFGGGDHSWNIMSSGSFRKAGEGGLTPQGSAGELPQNQGSAGGLPPQGSAGGLYRWPVFPGVCRWAVSPGVCSWAASSSVRRAASSADGLSFQGSAGALSFQGSAGGLAQHQGSAGGLWGSLFLHQYMVCISTSYVRLRALGARTLPGVCRWDWAAWSADFASAPAWQALLCCRHACQCTTLLLHSGGRAVEHCQSLQLWCENRHGQHCAAAVSSDISPACCRTPSDMLRSAERPQAGRAPRPRSPGALQSRSVAFQHHAILNGVGTRSAFGSPVVALPGQGQEPGAVRAGGPAPHVLQPAEDESSPAGPAHTVGVLGAGQEVPAPMPGVQAGSRAAPVEPASTHRGQQAGGRVQPEQGARAGDRAVLTAPAPMQGMQAAADPASGTDSGLEHAQREQRLRERGRREQRLREQQRAAAIGAAAAAAAAVQANFTVRQRQQQHQRQQHQEQEQQRLLREVSSNRNSWKRVGPPASILDTLHSTLHNENAVDVCFL